MRYRLYDEFFIHENSLVAIEKFMRGKEGAVIRVRCSGEQMETDGHCVYSAAPEETWGRVYYNGNHGEVQLKKEYTYGDGIRVVLTGCSDCYCYNVKDPIEYMVNWIISYKSFYVHGMAWTDFLDKFGEEFRKDIRQQIEDDMKHFETEVEEDWGDEVKWVG